MLVWVLHQLSSNHAIQTSSAVYIANIVFMQSEKSLPCFYIYAIIKRVRLQHTNKFANHGQLTWGNEFQ